MLVSFEALNSIEELSLRNHLVFKYMTNSDYQNYNIFSWNQGHLH